MGALATGLGVHGRWLAAKVHEFSAALRTLPALAMCSAAAPPRRRGLALHSLRAARRTLRTAYASSGPYGGGADFEPSNPAERAPTPRALSERSTAESSQIIFSLAHPPIPTREVRTISMNALHELFDIVLR